MERRQTMRLGDLLDYVPDTQMQALDRALEDQLAVPASTWDAENPMPEDTSERLVNVVFPEGVHPSWPHMPDAYLSWAESDVETAKEVANGGLGMDRVTIAAQLDAAQKGCRKRKMSADEALKTAKEVALFLVGCPAHTEVKAGLADRLPSSYTYPADATYVYGRVDEHGRISIEVKRGPGGFGARYAIVHTPDDYVAEGPGVHKSTGSTADLGTTTVVRKDRDSQRVGAGHPDERIARKAVESQRTERE